MVKATVKEVVDDLAMRSGHTKATTKEILSSLGTTITEFLKSGKAVHISGVGTLRPTQVPENKEAWNPKEQEYYTREPYINVAFKKSNSLKKLFAGQTLPEGDDNAPDAA